MMNNEVKIFDTTLRDGAQSVGVSFSLEDKLRLTRALDDMGVHYIEGGWPGSNPKDSAFFREARNMSLKNARLTAFSSTKFAGVPVEEDVIIRRLVEAGVPVATIFGKSWDMHVRKALKVDLSENLDMIFQTIAYLKRYFDEVIYDAEHFFDGYKANPGYAMQTLKTAQDAGAHWLVLCDTNGGTLTGECETIIRQVKQEVSLPLGIHAHNDGDLAVANSLAAVEQGIQMVQGTINGLGERCGNANLCSVIPNLSLKSNRTSIPLNRVKRLTDLSRLVAEVSNHPAPACLPFVGDFAFAHKGGIHVSAVNKEPATYEHIEPHTVGNKRFISVSELSGKSNILAKTEELGIKVDKASPNVRKILERVKDMESRGFSFEDAEASFQLLTQALLGDEKTYFNLYGYRVLTWKNASGETCSEATIKAGVPGHMITVDRKIRLNENTASVSEQAGEIIEHTTADASGPVEALDKALRKVLEKFYPSLKEVKLMDYKVRILNEEKATAAVTRVLIHSKDNTHKWGTVGVSDNIIDASWQALTDALVFKLRKDEEQAQKEAGRN